MDATGLTIEVHVRPGARQDTVGGTHDGALAVRVRARPVDGRANAAVEALLAEAFGLPARAVRVVGGATARRKRVLLEGDPLLLAARHPALCDGPVSPA